MAEERNRGTEPVRETLGEFSSFDGEPQAIIAPIPYPPSRDLLFSSQLPDTMNAATCKKTAPSLARRCLKQTQAGNVVLRVEATGRCSRHGPPEAGRGRGLQRHFAAVPFDRRRCGRYRPSRHRRCWPRRPTYGR